MGVIWKSFLLFFVMTVFYFGNMDTNLVKAKKFEYKQAFELSVDAALDSFNYKTIAEIDQESLGASIEYDTDKAITVFYDILKSNLSLNHVNDLKTYIPVKAFILNDHMIVYDNKDQKKSIPYTIVKNGSSYNVKIDDTNYYPFDKNEELSRFINIKINEEIRNNNLSNRGYQLVLDMQNEYYNRVDKCGFIVFTTGLPMPSLMPFDNDKMFITSIAGDLVERKDVEY